MIKHKPDNPIDYAKCIRCECTKPGIYFATLDGYTNEYYDAFECVDCIKAMVNMAIELGLMTIEVNYQLKSLK